jgi:hypothetical protein
VITLAVSIPAVIVMSHLDGVTGAAFSVVISGAAGLMALLLYQRGARRRVQESPAEPCTPGATMSPQPALAVGIDHHES